MTTQEFIDSIAGYIKKYAAAYNGMRVQPDYCPGDS